MKTRKGIVLVVKNKRGEFLLLKHKRDGLWGMISGGIERGETAIKAAVREAREEAGLSISPGELMKTREYISFVGSKGPGKQKVFYLQVDNPLIEFDHREIVDFLWSTKNEALKKLSAKPPLARLIKNF